MHEFDSDGCSREVEKTRATVVPHHGLCTGWELCVEGGGREGRREGGREGGKEGGRRKGGRRKERDMGGDRKERGKKAKVNF